MLGPPDNPIRIGQNRMRIGLKSPGNLCLVSQSLERLSLLWFSMKMVRLIVAVLVAQSAGLIGSLFTTPAIPTWYAHLEKPAFTPPGWIFGPVWVMLYTFMGIASFLVWQKRQANPVADKALVVYTVHLIMNALWSVLFFGLKSPGSAFVEIVILWFMILAVIKLFHRVDWRAAYLMMPYVLWVSFAAVLNFAIWRMN